MIIDITNEVYTNLKTTLTDVTVLPTYPSTIPVFPCITVEELTNTNNTDTHDSAGDHHSDASIEIYIYTNGEDRISKAKSIRNRIDVIMNDNYNMLREDSRPIPNPADLTLYRYVLRYSYTIDSNKIIYRR